MAAPPSTPYLASLGVMLGPELLDQLREMASTSTRERTRLQQELLEKALEKELAELEKERQE
jgi:predicted transcriptional regulator